MDFEKPLHLGYELDREGELGPGDWEDDRQLGQPMLSAEMQDAQHRLAQEFEARETARELLDVVTQAEKIYTIDGQVVDKNILIDLIFSLRTLLEFHGKKIDSTVRHREIENIINRPEVGAVLGLHDALIRVCQESR